MPVRRVLPAGGDGDGQKSVGAPGLAAISVKDGPVFRDGGPDFPPRGVAHAGWRPGDVLWFDVAGEFGIHGFLCSRRMKTGREGL